MFRFLLVIAVLAISTNAEDIYDLQEKAEEIADRASDILNNAVEEFTNILFEQPSYKHDEALLMIERKLQDALQVLAGEYKHMSQRVKKIVGKVNKSTISTFDNYIAGIMKDKQGFIAQHTIKVDKK